MLNPLLLQGLLDTDKGKNFQKLLNKNYKEETTNILKEGDPGTKVEKGRVISETAPGNTSFFGSLFGGQSSKPFQNQRALGLADILTFDKFDFDKRGNLFGPSSVSGFGGPADDVTYNETTGTYTKKDTNTTDPNKGKSDFEKIIGKPIDKYLEMVAQVGERAKDRDALRTGISNLAYAPILQAQLIQQGTKNIMDLTGKTMSNLASQNVVMASNPPKQKIASAQYFKR